MSVSQWRLQSLPSGCVSCFSRCFYETPDRSHLTEGGCMLAHGSRPAVHPGGDGAVTGGGSVYDSGGCEVTAERTGSNQGWSITLVTHRHQPGCTISQNSATAFEPSA